MRLTDIDTSVYYEDTLPSTGKAVKYRPFTIKEEKALLTAQQSEDANTMLATLESVVQNCVQNCPELTTFDVEYLFIRIRAKSVGEESNVVVACQHCDAKNTVTVDLTKVQLSSKPADKKLKISDKMVIVMKYPSINDVKKLTECKPEDQVTTAIAISIETIYFGDNVFHTKDSDIEEVVDFILNRTDDEMKPLIEFVENIPTVSLDVEFECRQCMKPNTRKISSLTDFF
jgi:hypothetical protein